MWFTFFAAKNAEHTLAILFTVYVPLHTSAGFDAWQACPGSLRARNVRRLKVLVHTSSADQSAELTAVLRCSSMI